MPGLGSNYLIINSTALPETASFDIEYDTVENVFQTEAGTDIALLIRGNKHKFSVKWDGATSDFKAQVESYCNMPRVTVQFDGGVYNCRARNLQASMVRYSNRWDQSNGLWDISFTLEEF